MPLFQEDPILNVLYSCLEKPLILLNEEPRKGRMRYVNHVRNNGSSVEKLAWQNRLSFLTRKNKIIIGPYLFDFYLPGLFSLETCTQEELVFMFQQTYPKDKLISIEDFKATLYVDKRISANALSFEERKRLQNIGDNVIQSFGFKKEDDLFSKPKELITDEDLSKVFKDEPVELNPFEDYSKRED